MNYQNYKSAFSIIVCIFLHVSLNGNFTEASIEVYDAVKLTNHAISTAIADIINVYYVQQGIPFDIHVYGNRTANISQILDGLLHQKEKNISVTTVKWFPNATEENLVFDQSAIVLFVDQVEIPKSKLTNEFPKEFKFLFFCLKGMCSVNRWYNYQLTDLGILPYYYGLDLKQNALYLYSIEWWWSPNNCMSYIHTIQNIFSIENFAWQVNLVNHKKYQNFHGCILTVSAEVDYPVYYPEKKKFYSHLIEMFEIMGRLKNFTPHFERLDKYGNFAFPGKKIFRNLRLSWSFMISDDLGNQHVSTIFSERTLKFVIPPGDLYTPYEKLLLPFDEQTWWFLIATFSATFAVIFLVNLLPKSVKKILYGDGVNMPAFNVVGTFFGIGQQKLPEGNFARIILITFIFFCLVIRTAYQGVQFDMMTKEMRRKPAQSIQQLYDENYTFLGANETKTLNALRQMIEPSKRSQVQVIGYDWVDVFSAVKGMNQSVKQALLQSTEDMKMIAENVDTLTVLPEVFFTCLEGISTDTNHFLFPALEEALQLTIPTGIAQYNMKIYSENRFLLTNKVATEIGPEILTVEGLSFGFVVWLVACGVSTCAFFMELFSFIFMKYICKSDIYMFYQRLYKKNQQSVSTPKPSILDPEVLNEILVGSSSADDETNDGMTNQDGSTVNQSNSATSQKNLAENQNNSTENLDKSAVNQVKTGVTNVQNQNDEISNVAAIFGELNHLENGQKSIGKIERNQINQSSSSATLNGSKAASNPSIAFSKRSNASIATSKGSSAVSKGSNSSNASIATPKRINAASIASSAVSKANEKVEKKSIIQVEEIEYVNEKVSKTEVFGAKALKKESADNSIIKTQKDLQNVADLIQKV